jgi:uncharacterized protein with HEPN domain
MPLDEQDLKYLWDMLEAARDAASFASGVEFRDYLNDRMRRFAIERTVEIIGEAARRVSQSGRDQVPGITWGAVVATRHILAHEYDNVDDEKIWRVASIYAPEMIEVLTPILRDNPPGPESLKDPGQP